MNGPEYAKRLNIGFVEQQLPARLVLIAAELTDELEADPPIVITPPAFYDIVEHTELKEAQYPAVLGEVLPEGARIMGLEPEDSGDPLWLVTYPMRIHTFCRTLKANDGGDAELNRDRILRGLVEVFLDGPMLGTSDNEAAVDTQSLRVRSGDLFEDTTGRLVSPGAVDLLVGVIEHLRRPLLSAGPTDLEVTVTHLPEEP